MLNNIRKIAILRALQLGDLLCAVPAFRALRAAYPEAEITLLGLPWASGFVTRYHRYIDHFVHFPGLPGLPEQEPGDFGAFARQMRDGQFDLVLQMQGNGNIVNDVLPELGASLNAGFWKPPAACPDPLSFIPYPDQLHEIHRHLELLQYLGIPAQGEHMEFPVLEADEVAYRQLDLPLQQKQYVCVHPGSRDAGRQWAPAYFALAADALAERGWTVVLTGTEAERKITDEVKDRMQHAAIDLTGATTLGSLGILLSRARLLVSNCTGTAHLSFALRTPSVIVSMDGEPSRWGPLNTSLHRQFDWTKEKNYLQVIESALALSR